MPCGGKSYLEKVAFRTCPPNILGTVADSSGSYHFAAQRGLKEGNMVNSLG